MPSSDATTRALWLARGFAGLLALTFGLIVLGALVRAHDAGLACPDWPLCFGGFIPEMNVQVAFEWTHRVVAGGVGLIFAALAGVTLTHPQTRRACAGSVAAAAALLAIQVVLGALTVWHLLASWTVTSHLVTGNAFAVALLWIALSLRESARGHTRGPVAPRLRAAVGALALLLVVQVVLGGLVSSRYAGLACPEWPTCNGGLWFPSWRGSVGLHLLHRTNGYLLLAALAGVAHAARHSPGLARPARIALALGALQVVVGILNVRFSLPVEITGLHSALAAALVLCVSWAFREAFVAGPSVAAPAALAGSGGVLQTPS